jgi:cytochrome c-type biogenesis protein CcmH
VRRAVALLVATWLLAAPAGAFAAGCPKVSLTDIEDEVMCLQCGVPLNVAEDAPSAKRERAFIQAQIARCESKQQIKDQLVAQFGDRILADPKSSSAWLVPAAAFGAGAVAIAFAAWSWRRKRVAAAGAKAAAGGAAPLPAGDAARLDADLDRYDL